MNYHGFAYPVKGFLIDGTLAPSAFGAMLTERRAAFPADVRGALQNLIDSHDTPRLATMVANRTDTGYVEPERFDYDWGAVTSLRQNPTYKVAAPDDADRRLVRLVALFQMTYVGAPMVYYGTEAGMWGADDPDDRKPMLWPDLDYDAETHHPLGRPRPADPVAFDEGLHAFYRDVIALRRRHDALRRGTFAVAYANDDAETLAFVRAYAGDTLRVVLNRSTRERTVALDGRAPALALDFATADGVRLGPDGVTLPPFAGAVLVRREGV
jgi:glycosidase